MGEVQVLDLFNPEIDIFQLAAKVPELKGTENKLYQLKKFLKPKIFWRDLNIEKVKKDELSFDGGAFSLASSYVAQGLKDCHKATLFAVTLGWDLPQYCQRALAQGRLWEATVADIFGSHGVEIVIENFHNYLQGVYLPKGLFSTLRFSPGYGDWSLKVQKNIIPYLHAEKSIKVTDNFLLEPVKTITALVGWSNLPQPQMYPQGDRKKGLCQGGNCAGCTTWACKK